MKRTARIPFRCLAVLLSLLFSVTAMTACFDLGDYGDGSSDGDDYTAYYDSFGDVRAFWREGEKTYGFERSLFNERTVNDFTWDTEAGDVPVESHPYVYLAIPVSRTMKIGSLTLFFNPDRLVESTAEGSASVTSGTLALEIFLLGTSADIPSNISFFDETEHTGEGEGTPEEPGEEPGEEPEPPSYDDPASTFSVASDTVTLLEGRWTDLTVDRWRQDGKATGTLSVSEGNVILIRFTNNSGMNGGELPRVRFSFTDLMIYKQGEN